MGRIITSGIGACKLQTHHTQRDNLGIGNNTLQQHCSSSNLGLELRLINN